MIVPLEEELLGVAFVDRTPELERRCEIIADITILATRERHDPTFSHDD